MSGQVQLIRSLDISGLFEEVHEFRQVEELSKAGSGTVAGSFRCKLNSGGSFTESRSPAVKVSKSLIADGVMLQIAHHGVQFRHGVGNRCAGGEDHALAVGHLIDITAFQQRLTLVFAIFQFQNNNHLKQ